MRRPLVTISIPTLNSAKFLRTCLNAIKNQSYKNIEINIIDGGSLDSTLDIAKDMGITKIFFYPYALLGARFEGVKQANGEYVLLLDSDQILDQRATERALILIDKQGYDMLVLEEAVYKPKNFLENLFQLDRKLIHSVKDFSPYTGVMLPRFYKTSILRKAFSAVPPTLLKTVGGQDHAIIYFEAWNISQKVGIVPNAVFHIEPNSLRVIWCKFYRWGRTSVKARYGKYNELISKKERFRTGMFQRGLIKASIASFFLLILKGVPYKIGYFRQKYFSRKNHLYLSLFQQKTEKKL